MRSGRLHTERRFGSCPAVVVGRSGASFGALSAALFARFRTGCIIHGMGSDGLDALIVRDATPDDLGFVQRMLYEAVNRPGDDWPTLEDCMEEPRNWRHWVGFMTREGDVG
jgi:hypothetical protein